jgi:ABC-type uncharacterized transport system auxiliary subunit
MKKLSLFLIILGVFAGCRSSKPVANKYYMIEFIPATMSIQDDIIPLAYHLEIADIDVHPAFATSQIALREEDHEVGYFVNHQWASRPQQCFERFTVNYMKHNNIFQHVERRYWNLIPEYRLYVTVNNLEVLRQGKDFFARLHVEFRIESSAGEVIESHFSDTTRLLEKRNLNLFAKAINNIYFEELNYFARKVHYVLSPAL